MLKKFFVIFLGSMAAIWLSAFLLLAGGLLFISSLVAGAGENMKVEANSVLVLDLRGEIRDRYEAPAVKDIVMGEYDDAAPTLDEMVTALELAANDPKISGVLIECSGSTMGYAARQELISAVEQFKKSGKWVYAYADNYTQGDYYVATSATRVFVNPSGSVDVHGLGSITPFFKNALDKLGIKVQIFKVGTFKSAVEPFILTEMSEPAKLQTREFLGSIWKDVTASVARARGVNRLMVTSWADSLLMTVPTDSLVSYKVVDEICYRRELDDKLRSLTSVNRGADLKLVTASEYLMAPNVATVKTSTEAPHIAVLYALGDIVDSGRGGIVGADMVPLIISLADDSNVKGLVMRVNSGGGSAFASEQIWDALQYFKSKGKPFYVSMGDYAASGGYYISCGADKIYCDPATLTGSIGIFGMMPDFQGLLNNHLGVNITTVGTGSNATFPNITSSLTAEQTAAMQRYVENGYALFTKRVADGRGLPLDSVLKIAEGRVWDGDKALKLGLVDGHADLTGVVKMMAKTTNIDARSTVAYPIETDKPLEALMRNLLTQTQMVGLMNSEAVAALGMQTPHTVEQFVSLINLLTHGFTIQARMEGIQLQ